MKQSRKWFNSGMTLLEVLIAIMLFAMFSGVTVMVAEMMAAMMNSGDASKAVQGADSAPLERAYIDQYFDQLVSSLEDPVYPPSKLNAALRQCKPTADELLDLDFNQIPTSSWPSGYRICLFDYASENPLFAEDLRAQKPGLYLLQAQPSTPSPLRQPVQRLFCRPRLLCS